MTTQIEAFPRSTMETLEQLRYVHASALEKAVAALDALSDDEKIAKRYDKAEEKVAECRSLVSSIDAAIAELHGMEAPAPGCNAGHTDLTAVAELACKTFNATAPEGVTASVVDPATGEVQEDELLAEAIKTALATGAASVALLQRRLNIGYGRAGKLIDRMAEIGIISGPAETGTARTLLLDESDISGVLAETAS